MKLSEHFTLAEYLRSYTATKYNISEQFNPPQSVINNIVRLNNVVQKIRNDVGAIRITSGYRCPRVNTRVGGVANSMHLTGEACDIGFLNVEHAMQVVDSAIKHGITRIGLGANFIHIDLKQRVDVWPYGRKTPRLLLLKQQEILNKIKNERTNN